MRVIGGFFVFLCAALGGVQIWAGLRRRADEFYILRSAGYSGLMTFEFASTPVRLGTLVADIGDRGREAMLRSLEIDHLVTAGWMFTCLGMGGLLSAVHRVSLGMKVLEFGLIATALAVAENFTLRRTALAYPDGASAAPIVTITAIMKWLFLGLAAVCVLAWPVRTFLS